ncbi:MAG TPA: metallophosphoesterase family protein [Tepidisphaeraceae bacterium]|jgi:serine/threonine protein phosphatase 1
MPSPLIYAVGDIHGSYYKLARLLKHCNGYCGPRKARFVFVGDYIDRGPHSREVVELLIELQKAKPGQICCLRGNHEDMLVSTLGDGDNELWLCNGGDMTLRSYGVTSADAIPGEHLVWFDSLPLFESDDKRFFVHAGIFPGVPLGEQRKDDMLWIREPFLSDPGDHGLYIVHGHTPLKTGKPEYLPNRLNLDTGAVFGGPLTAAVFDDSAVGPIAFITDDGTVRRAGAMIGTPEC